MALIKAFVAKSFAPVDEEKTRSVEKILDALKPLAGR